MTTLQYIIAIWRNTVALVSFMQATNDRLDLIESRLGKIETILTETDLSFGMIADALTADELRLTAIEKKLDQLVSGLLPGPLDHFSFVVTDASGNTTQGATHMQLKIGEQVTFSVNPEDKIGDVLPATAVDPSKSSFVDTLGFVTITVNPDGLSGTITATAIGSTQVQGSLTSADDKITVTGTLQVDVVAGDLAQFQFNTGQPVPIPPA